jgi:actin-related protein 8
MDIDQPEINQDEYDYALEELRGELRWRMKNAKRRAVPNAEGQVIGFNTTAVKETILDHNDPYKVEWTEVNKNIPYFVGEKVN